MVLSFYHADPGTLIQVLGLGSKCLLPTELAHQLLLEVSSGRRWGTVRLSCPHLALLLCLVSDRGKGQRGGHWPYKAGMTEQAEMNADFHPVPKALPSLIHPWVFGESAPVVKFQTRTSARRGRALDDFLQKTTEERPELGWISVGKIPA